MYQVFAPLRKIRTDQGLSERELSSKSGISRVTLRSIEKLNPSITLQNIFRYTQALDLRLGLFAAKETGDSSCSTIAVCLKVEREGFESWKTHFLDYVDEFRRSLDARLLLLAPPPKTPLKLKALLSSITLELCSEVEMQAPQWAQKDYRLPEPWFVSEMESLKASALVESPAYYKKNNIFVLENFLKRA